MSTSRQILWWLGILLTLLLFIYLLRPVLLPFVAGMAIAYVLDPACDWLERHGVGRLWATVILTTAFVLIILLGLGLFVPFIIQQLGQLVESLPNALQKLENSAAPYYQSLQRAFRLPNVNNLLPMALDKLGGGVGLIGAAVGSLVQRSLEIANILSLIFITPVVAFYLLRDWDRLVAWVNELLPRRHAPTIRMLGHQMDRALAGFARGQAAVCLIQAATYGIGYGLAGVPFGIVIGTVAGLFTFIPFVGSISGIALSIIACFLQDDPLLHVSLAVGVFVIGQTLEANIWIPKIVGDRTGLHAVWVIFALLAFGALFGFVGLLLAVPLATAMGVLARFALARYRQSPLYSGTE
ncbi:MAG TPA: AI-2E family transporter [Dongiaceae bacterium]|jgi:predicted PurR-regulated permease PerM|nr:AI-2E family transporter [Dongiaceae bacterium]